MSVNGIQKNVASKVSTASHCRCGLPGPCRLCDFYAHKKFVLETVAEVKLHNKKLIELEKDQKPINDALAAIERMNYTCSTTFLTKILETLLPLNEELNRTTKLY